MKYDKILKLGNTTVKLVGPPTKTDEEMQRLLKDFYAAAWAIIDELAEREA